jgi:hypothetical protein
VGRSFKGIETQTWVNLNNMVGNGVAQHVGAVAMGSSRNHVLGFKSEGLNPKYKK